jgi:hypothetical protein
VGDMTFRSKKLLEACRSLECQICGTEDGTICAAHSNSQRDGKGMGTKASDAAIAALCFMCHAQMDQGRKWDKTEKRELWKEAHLKTMRALIERGLLKP